MQVLIRPDGAAASKTTATIIASVLATKEHPVFGVATGSSPLATYQELARLIDAGELDMSRGYAFALDEYVGLAPDQPQSYAKTIEQTVTVPLRMDPARVHVPAGSAADLLAAAAEYEKAIDDAGGVDIQILGIGSNGHIGFNEPGTSLASLTHVVTLTTSTRTDNARFFDSADDVPRHALTQGLGTIMRARHVILIALGNQKADAVAAAVEGPVSAQCPASVLQFHPNATIVVDEAAAEGLERADYYRYVDENRLQLG